MAFCRLLAILACGLIVSIYASTELTLVVKTFQRPACLARLLKSIDEHAPKLPVVVVDDSLRAGAAEREAREQGLLDLAGGVTYITADYDVGVSKGRNLAMAKVKTPFVAILDDDFVLTAESRLERLVEHIAQGHADIAGGELYVVPEDLAMGIAGLPQGKGRRVVVSGAFTLGYDPRRKLLVSQAQRTGTQCAMAALLTNFFVARTKTVNALRWDDSLKLSEAEDFFFRAQKQGLKVKYCPAIKAMHDGQCTVAAGQDHEAYKRMRERGLHFQRHFFEKHDIQQYSTPNGGLYMLTCAFNKACSVAHMWKKDELKICDEEGRCEQHKVAIKKHPETKNMRLLKCDATGKKCDEPVMN